MKYMAIGFSEMRGLEVIIQKAFAQHKHEIFAFGVPGPEAEAEPLPTETL